MVSDNMMQARIVKAYRATNARQRSEGRIWYAKAYAVAKRIHPSYVAGAGVLAALSPQITWDENIAGAELICHAALNDLPMPDVAGYNINRQKAWKIARGEYWESPLELLSRSPGQYKVNNFYRNILGDQYAVTVDRWAARIALPDWNEGSMRGRTYLAVECAYQDAAVKLHSVTPAELQAIVWIAEREKVA